MAVDKKDGLGMIGKTWPCGGYRLAVRRIPFGRAADTVWPYGGVGDGYPDPPRKGWKIIKGVQ